MIEINRNIAVVYQNKNHTKNSTCYYGKYYNADPKLYPLDKRRDQREWFKKNE